MECKYCNRICQKWGKQKDGTQRYYCRGCKKYQQSAYKYCSYKRGVLDLIPVLVCESVSIRGIARILKISLATVIRSIRKLAASIQKPAIPINRNCFELDELRTYIGRKEDQYWVAYALCSHTKQVIDFVVGKRSKRTLKMIVNTLLISGVRTIRTDRLNIYRSLIPKETHQSAAYNINHIERNNLNLRTHLKRLSRRTICFSRSKQMLEACLKIYFWHSIFLKCQILF